MWGEVERVTIEISYYNFRKKPSSSFTVTSWLHSGSGLSVNANSCKRINSADWFFIQNLLNSQPWTDSILCVVQLGLKILTSTDNFSTLFVSLFFQIHSNVNVYWNELSFFSPCSLCRDVLWHQYGLSHLEWMVGLWNYSLLVRIACSIFGIRIV